MCTLVLSIKAQSKLDSIQRLDEVVVTAKKYKEVIPAQILKGEELQRLNSFSVADAIRYFSTNKRLWWCRRTQNYQHP